MPRAALGGEPLREWPGRRGGAIRLAGDLTASARDYWLAIQLPWGPRGMRAGRWTRATGSPVKSCAARMARSAASRSGLWTKAIIKRGAAGCRYRSARRLERALCDVPVNGLAAQTARSIRARPDTAGRLDRITRSSRQTLNSPERMICAGPPQRASRSGVVTGRGPGRRVAGSSR